MWQTIQRLVRLWVAHCEAGDAQVVRSEVAS
jgi:hypothetical protein